MLNKTDFISQDQKEQILKATDIVEVIGGYVQLKASGKNFLGLCPFHQEKTPSFTVSPAYQNYKCYGCGEFGDSIRFVMELENLSFVEAVQFLADRCGIKIIGEKNKSGVKSVQNEISICIQESFSFFRQNLINAPDSSQIKKYLHQRSISEICVEKFSLGYVGPGWTNLHDELQKKSIDISVQENAGLIKKGEKGRYYDRLRNRLIFPLRDIQGRCLGFAGRALGDESPKYLNPPETQLYKKSSVFYGVYEAKEQIRKTRRVIIVEGYLDVIRLHEFSWCESIATCGTSLTEEHVKAIKRLGPEEVILLFDGDKAGIKAAERATKLFILNDVDSKVVVLPDNLDPDDYFKKYNSEDFQSLLEKSEYDFEFIINRTKDGLQGKGIEFQEKAIKEISAVVDSIKSSIKKELFLSKAAKVFGIRKQEMPKRKQTFQKRDNNPHASNGNDFRFLGKRNPEVKFFQYLINHTQSINLVRKSLSPDDFIHRDLSDLYSRILQLRDDEFGILKPQELPDFFVEYGTLLMYLLHNESEYHGPAVSRSRSCEMDVLRTENEKLINAYSEDVLKMLIFRLKKQKKAYDLRNIRFFDPDNATRAVMRIVEKEAGHRIVAKSYNTKAKKTLSQEHSLKVSET
ncbi:DNA primase [bacterium]|nr:DNA primase [bacterium]